MEIDVLPHGQLGRGGGAVTASSSCSARQASTSSAPSRVSVSVAVIPLLYSAETEERFSPLRGDLPRQRQHLAFRQLPLEPVGDAALQPEEDVAGEPRLHVAELPHEDVRRA